MSEALLVCIMDALAKPFDPSEIKWKPKTIRGDKALMLPYVDARVVMDRLDEVMTIGGWHDTYKELTSEAGSVECTLSLFINGQWISKSNVGSLSEQPDDGDKLKAAYSDALKRAAVNWGIGRYLYRCAPQWVAFDPAKKVPVGHPKLVIPPRNRKALSGGAMLPDSPICQEQSERLSKVIRQLAEAVDVKPGVIWRKLLAKLNLGAEVTMSQLTVQQYQHACKIVLDELVLLETPTHVPVIAQERGDAFEPPQGNAAPFALEPPARG
ncbi:Rad52/Rad22 family DNA repair protein [Tuwongella immobilis]|uniref:Rad52/22 double-strand break repair protein n=1 Tax=Tuwongella immobilis TaxID=692036 RepID=A0A6C2YS38_9BACT|nr:Rad52/Rad22 family DNA repair protein [Tuwongella immobilis]VIP03943.1 rad52 22 double-strand break repair protein : Rad52/22 double-strand break repair protein OS=Thermus aquaticus Y51MC23 GN=TaqDRAFT_4252 PE=4 SV=1: Rad52_Rad22 [Tuwongella immobilis]VTS05253.1 rad52 22 double-strand break repair protein : Rad52/22 double-strand break repair protein OS=Thermus aquaticus Y51MC23 GN=TaqDRAFT_4252 PE=4 SV=1: Rad52_Rad22 [Tuwongella immobilis]